MYTSPKSRTALDIVVGRSYSYGGSCLHANPLLRQCFSAVNGDSRAYYVKNVGNSHEAYRNAAKERIAWANAQVAEKLSRLSIPVISYVPTRMGSIHDLQRVGISHRTRREKVRCLRILMQHTESMRSLGK